MSHENTHKRITEVVEDIRLFQELLKNLKAQHADLISKLDVHTIADGIQPARTPYYEPYEDCMRVAVMRAHRKGYSLRQIEMLTGVSKSTVSRWLRAQQTTKQGE